MKITVIMPCYNREYDLRRVLEAYDQQDIRINTCLNSYSI
jgi:glycosyltransferase involved in cell wall biosynthesis